MDFLDRSLQEYVEAHSQPEPALLQELSRETQLKVLMPQMLSGHLQGQVIRMFSKILRPRRILEIGTFTGYSGICLSDGLADDGILHSIDINDELQPMVEKYWKKAGIWAKSVLHLGDATSIIPALDEDWDLVFIDADKENYPKYFDLVIDRLKSGGLILGDNTLWSGKVLEKQSDRDTEAIKAFNKKVQQDDRVENVLLPVRDGLMVVRKR